MDLTKNNIKPFFSLLLAETKNKKTAKEISESIIKLICSLSDYPDSFYFENLDSGKIITENSHEDVQSEFSNIFYSIRKSPAWSRNVEVYDVENHILSVITYGSYCAIYTSEKGIKDKIRDSFYEIPETGLAAVNIHKLFSVFINEDNIKMLWLLGTQSRSSSKAQSKVLAGKNVADTLDPLADQSYTLSAARTELNTSSEPTSMGINPYKSSIWHGQCSDWEKFEGKTLEVLEILNNSKHYTDANLSILANPVKSISDLEEIYDLCFIDPETYYADISNSKLSILNELKTNYTFEITSGFSKSKIYLTIFRDQTKVGDLTVVIKLINNLIDFEIEQSIPTNKNKSKLDEFSKIFRHPELINCWFESGHAIVDGRAFKLGFRDVEPKKLLYSDFSNYNIKKEKPGTNNKKPELDKIGNEKSMFCWVKNHWNGKWLSEDEYCDTTRPTGWLFCDDGAGEKADFIHAVEHNGLILISLIHVKAATSDSPNRKISIGVHDVLLNQAIKNIKHCSRKVLADELKNRLNDSDKKMCWFDGAKKEPSEFIAYLNNINKNSNIRYRVIAIQPHTLKSYYQQSIDNNIYKQFNILVANTDNAIRSTGAQFSLVGSIM